jgi:hypothetical protein
MLSAILMFGCTDKPTEDEPAGGANTVLTAKVTTPEFLQLVDLFILEVTARDIEPIVDTLLFDGRYITGEVDVPAGVERRFVLKAMASEVVGLPGDSLVYYGETVATVRPDAVNAVTIEMRPAIAMVRLSPRWTEIPAGSPFEVDLEVYNIEELNYLEVWFDYNTLYIDVLSAAPSLSVGSGAEFSASPWNDDTVYRIMLNDTSGHALVNRNGYANLATVRFSSRGFAESETGGEPIITQAWFTYVLVSTLNNDTTAGVVPYEERALIEVWPLAEQYVTFPDANLEAAIRSQLSQPTGPIALGSLLNMDTLSAWDYYNPIQDLTGIERLVNLRRLYLADHNISDLGPLSQLYRLLDLDLGRNQVTDLVALGGLSALQRLRLSYNQIDDANPLDGLTSLWTLDLSGNQITDLGFLSSMQYMYQLYLNDNSITDMTPVGNLRNIYYLELGSNQISDISALTYLYNLYSVILTNNNISNIYPLVENAMKGGLGDGDWVYLTGNPLDSISEYEYIPQLRNLGVNVSFGMKRQ